MEEIDYLVRVSCMTYNQASYIKDAMNGFCMQETTFPFVCVIIDDASKDGEQEVIRHFVEEKFDLGEDNVAYEKDTDYGHVTFARNKTNWNCFFSVIYLNENHFSLRKPKAPYFKEWMDTKYVALCEGDDYWLDPEKLQKQVSFLEEHPDFGFVGTNVKVDNNGVLREEPPMVSSGVIEGDFELIGNVFEFAKCGPPARTVSLCYRKEVVQPYVGYLIGDIVLETILAKFSKYAVYRNYASVYRKGIGISSSQTELNRALRYNRYYVTSRKIQKKLFPEDCSWNDDELADRGVYVRLIYDIRKLDWREGLKDKNKLKSRSYKNKTYSKYLFGPVSCFMLNRMLKIKRHE